MNIGDIVEITSDITEGVRCVVIIGKNHGDKELRNVYGTEPTDLSAIYKLQVIGNMFAMEKK